MACVYMWVCVCVGRGVWTCGPESTWSPALWGADWGKEEDTPDLGQLNSLEANEEKKCKTHLARKHTVQGRRWGPQLDSLNKQGQPWVLWKSHPHPNPLGAMAV